MEKSMNEKCRVLLVEDNPGDARLTRQYLAEAGPLQFEVTHADRFSTATEYLAKMEQDVILLDMALPDGRGPDLVAQVLTRFPAIPVIVLTGTYKDEAIALEALKNGAEDYLIKDRIDAPGLVRAIRYAIQRKRAEELAKKAARELQEKVVQLERLNRIMMDREERILELKEEVRKLQAPSNTNMPGKG